MEYGFFNDIANYFASDSFKNLINIITIVVFIYIIVLFVVIMPVFFIIFKKEKIPAFYALIPFFNIYVYLSFIDIFPILGFVPIANIATVHFSIPELARIYRCNKLIRFLAYVLPPIALILIALNKEYTIEKVYRRNRQYLKKVNDVDAIENHLETQAQYIMSEGDILNQEKPIDESYKSLTDYAIDAIEQNAIRDDIDEDLMMMESNIKEEHLKEVEKNKEDNTEEELINSYEIQDLFENNDIRTNKIEDIVNQVDEKSTVDIIDNAEYKDVQAETKDVKNIAFGGISQDDKVIKNVIESKDNSMYCPYCKSELKDKTDSCPGCGKLLPK